MGTGVARGIALLVTLGCTLGAAAYGFSNYAVGEVLPDLSLTPLAGGAKQPWLGKAKVNVFFFFTPGSKNSQLGVKELAALEQELAGKPVAFVGLVSSSVPAADAQKDLAVLKLSAPVLVDEGDVLYGKLGTALTPVVGITDEKHKLLAYLPFTKIQYQDTIRAWIRFGLGEITPEQLKATLEPPAAAEGGEVAIAQRYLKLAERQQKAGNLDSALGAVRKSLEHGELAGARVVLGALLSSKGSCAEAAIAHKRALELDPANEQAKSLLTGCGAADGGGSI